MDREKFEGIKQMFGDHASWAMWAQPDGKGADGIGDMSVFDMDGPHHPLKVAHTKYVLMGLNMSSRPGDTPEKFRNFHARNGGRDFMLRNAIRGTELWGAYITDLIVNPDSSIEDSRLLKAQEVAKWAKEHPNKMSEQAATRRQELTAVGAKEATLVALGSVVHSLLLKYFADHRIIKVTHYAAQISSARYRAEVVRALEFEAN